MVLKLQRPNSQLKTKIAQVSLIFLLSVIGVIFSQAAKAQVLAPSAEELEFNYISEVIGDLSAATPEELANKQASHMFGLFASPKVVSEFGLNYDLVGGIGVPRTQMKIRIIKIESLGSGIAKIKYSNKGKLLVHKKVAKNLLKKGKFVLPLPADVENFYDPKCTDEHYQSFGDFWYFYNPFQKNCEYLTQAPYAVSTLVYIQSPKRQIGPDVTPRLDLVRGGNDNGSLFSIYVIHGYAESQKNRQDEGRLEAESFADYLKDNGFEQKTINKTATRPLSLFTKELKLANGQIIQVEIKHLLVETAIESRGFTFAKFFKEAVESADVIIYAGHSGLGGNLDIESLELKAGKFKFNPKKKQIFLFEACSSYSYYLETFAAEKTKAKIDILTNGLSSYFSTSSTVVTKFMDFVLNPRITDATWMSVLKSMERPLEGGTYLLNVGGL